MDFLSYSFANYFVSAEEILEKVSILHRMHRAFAHHQVRSSIKLLIEGDFIERVPDPSSAKSTSEPLAEEEKPEIDSDTIVYRCH